MTREYKVPLKKQKQTTRLMGNLDPYDVIGIDCGTRWLRSKRHCRSTF